MVGCMTYNAEPGTIRVSILTHGGYEGSPYEWEEAEDRVDSLVSARTMHYVPSENRTKRQSNTVGHQVHS
jgi:hypothetical protein